MTRKRTTKTLGTAVEEVRAGRKAPSKKPAAKAEAGTKEEAGGSGTEPAREGLVVFAFRLTAAEREQIHRVAGRGKASWFVKTVALTVATRDRAGFESVVEAVGMAPK